MSYLFRIQKLYVVLREEASVSLECFGYSIGITLLILLFIFPLVALLLTYLFFGFRNNHHLGKYPCVRKIMELFATCFVRQRMEISACSFTITVLV